MPRLIDADALESNGICFTVHGGAKYGGAKFISLESVRTAPTIEAEPVKHGQWVETEDGEWECTNCKNAVVICACGKDVTRHKTVCPNCGATMDGGADHEN